MDFAFYTKYLLSAYTKKIWSQQGQTHLRDSAKAKDVSMRGLGGQAADPSSGRFLRS